jgi:hypothetical protein
LSYLVKNSGAHFREMVWALLVVLKVVSCGLNLPTVSSICHEGRTS